jgi:drug/metabolite transporter (DMT)-like permease
LYYGVAFWLYIMGLRQASATVAGSFITLVPVFGLAAGYLVGERLTRQQWVGGVVVIVAMAVVAVRHPNPHEAMVSKERRTLT